MGITLSDITGHFEDGYRVLLISASPAPETDRSWGVLLRLLKRSLAALWCVICPSLCGHGVQLGVHLYMDTGLPPPPCMAYQVCSVNSSPAKRGRKGKETIVPGCQFCGVGTGIMPIVQMRKQAQRTDLPKLVTVGAESRAQVPQSPELGRTDAQCRAGGGMATPTRSVCWY